MKFSCKTITLIVMILSICFTTIIAEASDITDTDKICSQGYEHYKAGEYEQAIECFRLAAEQGDKEAQFELGLMHYYGEGTSVDYRTAISLFKKVVDDTTFPDVAQARYLLGCCYEYGEGVSKDNVQALYWFKQAAATGDAFFQQSLGNHYAFGDIVEQDYVEAVKWYLLSVEQGYDYGQYSLGTCYEEGKGVEQNVQKAFELYKLAAAQGNPSAEYAVGKCYYYGRGVKADLKEAKKWLELAVNDGDDYFAPQLLNELTKTESAVFFGRYKQSTNIDSKEPIEWLILKQDSGKALLISKKLLDAQPYNQKFASVSWEHCSLRRWLNDTFYNEVFTEEEKSCIIPTSTSDGVLDSVFLLSEDEASELFSSDEARTPENTRYVELECNNTAFWWLRSAEPDVLVPSVYPYGGILLSDGSPLTSVTTMEQGIRPAVWVDYVKYQGLSGNKSNEQQESSDDQTSTVSNNDNSSTNTIQSFLHQL